MTLVEVLAIIGAIMGPVAGMYALHVGRLRDRDKQEADLRSKEADLKVKDLRSSIDRCELDCKSAREQVTTAQTHKEIAEIRAAKLEGELAGMTRENKELRDENHALRDRLLGDR